MARDCSWIYELTYSDPAFRLRHPSCIVWCSILPRLLLCYSYLFQRLIQWRIFIPVTKSFILILSTQPDSPSPNPFLYIMIGYYLLLLLASLPAETVVSSYLFQNEFGPIPDSNIGSITSSQPKQQLHSIPLDSDSVGGSDDHLGTGEGTRVSLNHDDRPVHAPNGYHPPPSPKSLLPDLDHQDFLSTTQVAKLCSNPELAPPRVVDSTVVTPKRNKYTAKKCWIPKT